MKMNVGSGLQFALVCTVTVFAFTGNVRAQSDLGGELAKRSADQIEVR